MPTTSVTQARLHELLGRTLTEKELDDILFDFGGELDVTTEKEIVRRMEGRDKEEAADEVLYKIDLPANRYDLLSAEGLVSALKSYLGMQRPPQYVTPPPQITMHVSSNLKGVRPFVVCAVLRNIAWNEMSYNSFIDVQEKLHGNLCRKRHLVSIGTHDLDTIQPPFYYAAVPRSEIAFVPLRQTDTVTGEKFLELYRDDKHLGRYLSLLDQSADGKWPLIRDSNGTVLSLPPIINSAHSRMSPNMKNVFIEVTAVDEYKANVVLNQLVCNFSLYSGGHVESVRIVYEDGREVVTPDLRNRTIECNVARMCRGIGVNLTASEMVPLLEKMMIAATVKDDQTVIASIPPTRTDVLHECDIAEDVAIGYGYNRIAELRTPVPTLSIATQQPLNKLTHLVRCEFAHAGYTEVLTYGLCSVEDAYNRLRLDRSLYESEAVKISNPQTMDFQVCRPSLLPGMLKAMQHAKAQPLPVQIFEVSDVVVKDASTDTGARNRRHAAALYCSKKSSLEVVHGLLDLLLLKLGVSESRIELKASMIPTYLDGRQAEVYCDGRKIGHFGVLHPEVLGNFDLSNPISYMEVDMLNFV